MEKKIFLDKKDGIEKVLEEIRRTKAGRIILTIPNGSVLGTLVNNFHRLNREGELLEKEIIIESVDDHILELASLAQLVAANPIFQRRERAVVDIIPRVPKRRVSALQREAVMEKEIVREEVKSQRNMPREEVSLPAHGEKRVRHSHFPRMSFVVTFLLLIAIGAGAWVVMSRVLPEAIITLELQKAPVDFTYTLQVSTKTKETSIVKNVAAVPGELLVSHQNLSQAFPAHGKETIEKKATGKLTVWNAYSSQPQAIVESTRFESPDHKIFRLNQKTTIPGAKVVNGKIVPSSIEVDVTADQAGEAYNISPATGWKIPGFKGTPKYEGFYAESNEAMSGGSVGEHSVATPDDVLKARQAIEKSLKDALQNQMLVLIADQFKLLPDATKFTILKEEAMPGDANSNFFTMFAEGEMRYLVFQESMLQEAIVKNATSTIEGSVRSEDFQINYGSSTANFTDGTMTVHAKGSLALIPDLDVAKLKAQILGNDEQTLRDFVLNLPGVVRANIALQPFWVQSVPTNPQKVDIRIQEK